MPRPAPLRVTAVEIATEIGEERRGLLRIERADLVKFDRDEIGPGRLRVHLIVEGSVRGIPDRYTGGRQSGGGR